MRSLPAQVPAAATHAADTNDRNDDEDGSNPASAVGSAVAAVFALIVDHGLRAGSAAEAQLTSDLVTSWGLQVIRCRIVPVRLTQKYIYGHLHFQFHSLQTTRRSAGTVI